MKLFKKLGTYFSMLTLVLTGTSFKSIASEGEEEMNVEIAFWGGGQYIPVDAADTAQVVQAIEQLTDLKFTIGCE